MPDDRMTAETARLVAALTAEAAACRVEAARFTDVNPRHPIRVDPSRGQADPAAYARVNLILAGFCESLADRLTRPGGVGAAEGKLAAIADACRSIPTPIAERILAIIGAEEGEGRG